MRPPAIRIHTEEMPKPKPSVYYVYIFPCEDCGATVEAKRSDARLCKRCKWKLRQRRYYERYPERVKAYKQKWNSENLNKRRAHRVASYHRNIEVSRARNRENWKKTHAMKPSDVALAQSIRELAIV